MRTGLAAAGALFLQPNPNLTNPKPTNHDVYRNRSAADIHARMKEMWQAAARDGATVLVIPPLPNKYKSGEPARRELVGRIKATVADLNRAGDRSVLLLDLERPFDLDAMAGEQRARVFDDGLHLTDYGYQQYLAGLIYDGLVKAMGA